MKRNWAYFQWLAAKDMNRPEFGDGHNPYKDWWEATYNPDNKYDPDVRGVRDFTEEELEPCIKKLEEILGLDDVTAAAMRTLLESQDHDDNWEGQLSHTENHLDESPPF